MYRAMKTLTEYFISESKKGINAFCMLKPGFTQYKDEFERQLKSKGWKIKKCKTKTFTKDEIEKFYGVHKYKPFFQDLCGYMTSGECICYGCYMDCEDPTKNMDLFKDNFRKEYGEDDMRNAMHSSDSLENVEIESDMVF